ALQDLGEDAPAGLRRHVALVPYGGYGRRALAPFSDVDLMILHSPAARRKVSVLVTRLLRDLFDVGLNLGHSVRTPADVSRLAGRDATIYSSLIETRLLVGSDVIYRQFRARFDKLRQRRAARLVATLLAAREHEQAHYGQTIYLLEPNVKRSRGGLRDIQLLRWLGYVKFGEPDPDRLQLSGALSPQDQRTVREANEFLMRIRTAMHLHAGKAQDVLSRREQVRLAELFGVAGTDALLPVEAFMRDYFWHTGNVRYLVSRFAASVQPSPGMMQVIGPVLGHQVAGDYRVGPREISATGRGLVKLRTDLVEVLRLSELANRYDKRIAPATWAAVYRATPHYSATISAAVAERFLALLDQPPRLAELLRNLHELRVLEKIVPAFAHARGLLQFNEYHKYTVDEHCIRAVEYATGLVFDPGPVGRAYRKIKSKRTLHLALLLHDLGKGLPGDHSAVGRDIAQQTAARLGLPAQEAELVTFLVHKHLIMSHLAFRRDTGDEALVVRFAVEVGSPEILRMLYVLTCADLAAVGPGVLNSWKVEVLTRLLWRTMQHLGGDVADASDWGLEPRRHQVRACFAMPEVDPWLEAQIHALSPGWLLEQGPAQIAASLRRLRALPAGGVDAWGNYLATSQTLEFLVAADATWTRGLFYKLTGALTSQGLAILSAQIDTLVGGLVLDRFVVEDPDYVGPPSAERIATICSVLVESIRRAEPPTFRRVWGGDRGASRKALSRLPSQVRIDNSTSDRYTILELFTFDCIGLLYKVARELFELDLSIGVAKIGTYLDQVVDVFYVTDLSGQKVEDESRLEQIRRRLLAALD
ncbi:MAG: [protein-PII] uridylyltransferase, partial [Planctomycetes bacterium RBG_16_64_10]